MPATVEGYNALAKQYKSRKRRSKLKDISKQLRLKEIDRRSLKPGVPRDKRKKNSFTIPPREKRGGFTIPPRPSGVKSKTTALRRSFRRPTRY